MENRNLESLPPLELTKAENHVVEIAEEYLQRGLPQDGFQEVCQLVEDTGCQIEFVKSGSDPNRGRLERNRFFPKGKIVLMDTFSDTAEGKLFELVHEFIYLQLYIQAVPDLSIKDDPDKLQTAIGLFISGLRPRIQTDIRITNVLRNEKTKESIIRNKKSLLEKLKDFDYAYEHANKFLLYH